MPLCQLAKQILSFSTAAVKGLRQFLGILPDIRKWLNRIEIGVGIVKAIEELILQFSDDKPLDEKELLFMFEYITSRLEQIQYSTGRIEETLHDLAKGLPSLLDWVITLNALEQNIMPINNLYSRFTYYQKLRKKLEKQTLLDFAQNVVSHSTISVQSLMDNIHSITASNGSPHTDFRSNIKPEEDANNRVTEQFSIIGQKLVDSNEEKYKNRIVNTHKSEDPTLRQSIFQILKNVIDNSNLKLNQSPQQFIFRLYTFITLTLARGYGMINFSYQILKLNNQGNFTVELQLAKKIYENHSTAILKNAITIMSKISNAHRTYDPHHHVEGKTFEMVTKFLQIVTGVKFIKERKVIHIQVQQGNALPRGLVDSSTVHWMNVKPISVDTKKFFENVDYVKLNYTTRKIDLDYLTAPIGHIVTGIKFRLIGAHVSLQVLVTPINFTMGILAPNDSSWLSNNTTKEFSRSEVILHSPDDPTKAKSESVVDSVSNMFVTLQPTDAIADVSQLTVPFFDAQPVSLVPPTWLEGIQLYHRGSPGYGGFLGFGIFNYNITHNLEETMNRASNLQSEASN